MNTTPTSKRQSFQSYMARTGENVTAKQARTMFKVDNVADLVYKMRNEGVPVYTNRKTLKSGEQVFAYRIGEPNPSFMHNMKSRHKARARRALYAEALFG